MWNAFRGALAVLTRKTELAVWALIFPIILSTLFMFMFANLDESTAFEAVPTAVVADDAYRADEGFSTLVDELSQPGDDQLLGVREFATAEEARGALEAGDVVGVLSVDGEGMPHLAVSPVSDGMGVSTMQVGRTILNTVADTYVRNADLLQGIAHDNPMALADPDLVERALSQDDATVQVSLCCRTHQSVRFYYALLGMACLFCAQIGMVAVCEAQPNLSPLGARRAVGAVSRGKTLAAALAASWVLATACLLAALAYRFTAGIDFAGREIACVGAIAVCALFSTAFGTLLGSLPKVGFGVKTGLLTGTTCLLSLFAGLYGEPVMNMADQLARDYPLLASLNPAKVVTDTFYSLYYYDSLAPFAGKLGLLLSMTAVVFAVSALFIRRQRYASI